MSDIAARLKDHYADKDADAWMICVEAADEIEQNRIDLEEYRLDVERLWLALEVAANDLEDWGAYTKANNARAALGGE